MIHRSSYKLGNYNQSMPLIKTRNNWTATRQIKPRNLPGKVNEYGFDVSTTSGFWVIKE